MGESLEYNITWYTHRNEIVTIVDTVDSERNETIRKRQKKKSVILMTMYWNIVLIICTYVSLSETMVDKYDGMREDII